MTDSNDDIASTVPEVDQSIIPTLIDTEMQNSYLDYAMSVIVSRALPDVRDGLKPVHRRILYAMYEAGYEWNKQYRKSARVVGDVMGKYHPHGDQSVYDALVRLAQDFSMRLPLIDGQGNFGSMDGDRAAAMRYTEVRMDKISKYLLEDIDKETIDFRPNYDESEYEPSVLPAKYPNLLVNGAGGIAVGMATNILPHNLGEVIDATIAFIKNKKITDSEINNFIKGPDFPTGGTIVGTNTIKSSQKTGRGSIVVQAKSTIEEFKSDRDAIIFSEIPYQVNKSILIQRIAELVRDKKIEGISDLRDESDRDGVRIVIELKKGVISNVILNKLYKYTPLQSSYGVNALALTGGRPKLMGIRDFLSDFVKFRVEIITNRTKFDLNKARDRAHLLIGLGVAIANVDNVIEIIKKSKDPADAKRELLKTKWKNSDIADLLAIVDDPRQIINENEIYLTEDQAKAILELRLQRLTALGKNEIESELKELSSNINGFLEILTDKEVLLRLIEAELTEVKDQFATPRRTDISEMELAEFDQEDLVQKSDMVISVSNSGYIKRVPLEMYRAQKRGGKGKSGITTRDQDSVIQTLSVNTHTSVLFFSTEGLVYKIKAWKIPEGSTSSKGKSLFNILPLKNHQSISSIMPMPENDTDLKNYQIIFATAQGKVRKNSLDDFSSINASGKIAMKLDNNDKIVGVKICQDDQDIILSTKFGKCIRFEAKKLRVFKGRSSKGIKGIELASNDQIVSLSVIDNDKIKKNGKITKDEKSEIKAKEKFVLSISENGYGKKTSHMDYRVTNRGGKGIIGIVNSPRNGNITSSFPVFEGDEILISTNKGRVIRVAVKEIRSAGRNTQGVRIIKLSGDEKVVSAIKIDDNLI